MLAVMCGSVSPASHRRSLLTFIAGTSQVDGEILESLWSVLNEISPSTQNTTQAAFVETLDDHMGDSNFKKMLDIGELFFWSLQQEIYSSADIESTVVVTCHQYRKAIQGEEDSRMDLEQYTVNTNLEELDAWMTIAKWCQEAWLVSPEAMDICDIDPGQTRTQSQLELVLAEGESGTGKG
jgi:hypothetical protein